MLSCRKHAYHHGTCAREGEQIMAEVMERLERVQLPPHVREQLGLDKDWQRKVPRDFLERVLKTASKYEHVLRELSKR